MFIVSLACSWSLEVVFETDSSVYRQNNHKAYGGIKQKTDRYTISELKRCEGQTKRRTDVEGPTDEDRLTDGQVEEREADSQVQKY